MKKVIAVAVVAAVVAGCIVLRSVDTLPTEGRFETLLAEIGYWGPVAVIALRAVMVLLAVLPSAVLVIAAGAAYGVVWASIYTLVGAEIGAGTAFLLGAWLGRGFMERRGWLQAVSATRVGRWLLSGETSQRRLTMAVLGCRLVPGLNLDGLSYVAGLTPLRLWRFLLATAIGILPYTIVFALLGQGLMRAQYSQIALALSLLALLIALPISVRYWLKWCVTRRRKTKLQDQPEEEDCDDPVRILPRPT